MAACACLPEHVVAHRCSYNKLLTLPTGLAQRNVAPGLAYVSFILRPIARTYGDIFLDAMPMACLRGLCYPFQEHVAGKRDLLHNTNDAERHL